MSDYRDITAIGSLLNKNKMNSKFSNNKYILEKEKEFLRTMDKIRQTSPKKEAVESYNKKIEKLLGETDSTIKKPKNQFEEFQRKKSNYESDSNSDTESDSDTNSSTSSRSSGSSTSRSSKSSNSSRSSTSSKKSISSNYSKKSNISKKSLDKTETDKINNAIGLENQKDIIDKQNEKTCMLGDIENLKEELKRYDIDTDKIPGINGLSENDDYDKIKNAFNLIQGKYDSIKLTETGTSLAVSFFSFMEHFFDGRTEYFGRRPNLSGFHNTASVKLGRVSYNVNRLMRKNISEFSDAGRIALEIFPALILHLKNRSEETTNQEYDQKQLRDDLNKLRTYDDIKNKQ